MTPKRKRKRKSYTDEFRANTVLMLEAAGYPHTVGALARVARKVNAPSRTISRWFNKENNPPPDKLVTRKKSDLIAELKELLGLHIVASTEAVQGYEDLRAIDTGIGILIDKLQLLSGEPTDRQEVNVSDHRERILARVAEKSKRYVTESISGNGDKPVA